MSRLAAKPIPLPAEVSCTIEGDKINLKNGSSTISIPFKPDFITIKVEGSSISLAYKEGAKILASLKGLLGTLTAHIKRGIENICTECKVCVNFAGVGYRAAVVKAGEFSYLKMTLGFSHPIFVFIPSIINVKMDKESAIVSGPTQKIVSDFCALIRNEKKPTIYHGTGVLVNGEIVNKKVRRNNLLYVI
jgi:large subunit ribosomal protein L6